MTIKKEPESKYYWSGKYLKMCYSYVCTDCGKEYSNITHTKKMAEKEHVCKAKNINKGI